MKKLLVCLLVLAFVATALADVGPGPHQSIPRQICMINSAIKSIITTVGILCLFVGVAGYAIGLYLERKLKGAKKASTARNYLKLAGLAISIIGVFSVALMLFAPWVVNVLVELSGVSTRGC